MKIEIDINEKYEDTAVVIQTPKLTKDIEKVISLIRTVDSQITVSDNDETIVLDTATILYIEALERNTFVYTKSATYQSDIKLYELEEVLSNQDFIRVSKQMIVNLRKVKSLKADVNRKIRVTLQNDEQIMVSHKQPDFVDLFFYFICCLHNSQYIPYTCCGKD